MAFEFRVALANAAGLHNAMRGFADSDRHGRNAFRPDDVQNRGFICSVPPVELIHKKTDPPESVGMVAGFRAMAFREKFTGRRMFHNATVAPYPENCPDP
jgi:hypothetical protein